MKNRRVLVLGGGVGGLSAAHELVERGFDVEVVELKSIPGGKARSVPVPDSGRHGRAALPGEHGFRFFPGFYRHLPDTMKRIPYQENPEGCFDNLVATSRVALAQAGPRPTVIPSHFPDSLGDWETIFHDLTHNDTGLTPQDVSFYMGKLWQVMTSSKERRLAELEQVSWWTFVDAANRSPAYQKFLASGMSRSLVAAQAQEASARTIGQVQVHLMSNVVSPGVGTDRVLCGPTNSMWIYPWLSYLQQQGVRYQEKRLVKRIHCEDGRITGVDVADAAAPEKVTARLEADWYVAALPIERFAPLLTTSMVEAAPELGELKRLSQSVRWMNGIQFYLYEDVPVVHGHVLYVDSAWAITSISQPQFWQNVNLGGYGDGRVRGILSVDISDWTADGTFVKKLANECSKQEIADEVWRELKQSLNVGGQTLLRDEMLHSWFLDTDVVVPPLGMPRRDINLEPLFINRPDSWNKRPEAATAIPNLFLASDYVQTNTDLACMEAANEAARRSVNAILQASGNPATPCRIFEMGMPEVLAPWREHDLRRFQMGLPWDGRLFG
ncbi:hydroxysqualene dehydroxylase [Corallococcus sp. M7]